MIAGFVAIRILLVLPCYYTVAALHAEAVFCGGSSWLILCVCVEQEEDSEWAGLKDKFLGCKMSPRAPD